MGAGVLPEGMSLDELLSAVREAAGERAWGAAVRLSRDGAVRGVSDDGAELCFNVDGRGGRVHEVFLWPQEPDWGCDCGLPVDCCVHIAAATISNRQGLTKAGKPAEKAAYRIRVRYDFTSHGQSLAVSRVILRPDGRVEEMTQPLSESRDVADRWDVQVERLLVSVADGPLAGEHLRRVLTFLEGRAEGTLDGEAIQLSPEPISFMVRVSDEGDGFGVRLVRPLGIGVSM